MKVKMSTSITFEEALQLTHPEEKLDKVKETFLSPQDIADNLWAEKKDSIISEVRNTLTDGNFEYYFAVTEYEPEVVAQLKNIFKDEFTPSGARVSFVPQHCDECESYLVVDYSSLNRSLVIKKKAEAIDRMNRNTFIVLGTGALLVLLGGIYACF